MPAAAVIPAPIAYIKVVAVKTLVVGFLLQCVGPSVLQQVGAGVINCSILPFICSPLTRLNGDHGSITLRKLGCFRQSNVSNTLAWNNTIGLWFYFVGF